MLTAYFKFEVLPDHLKALHNIKSKVRLDCTLDTNPKNYAGLTPFVNAKGQMYLFKIPAREIVKANSKRLAEWALYNGRYNLSSLYFEDIDYPEYSYGYPNANRLIGKQEPKPNPLFPFRNDAYLFIANADLSQVEILVIAEGRNLVTGYYQHLIDGYFDQELETLRQQARPFFDYGSAI